VRGSKVSYLRDLPKKHRGWESGWALSGSYNIVASAVTQLALTEPAMENSMENPGYHQVIEHG
jgi:hypothetical protein